MERAEFSQSVSDWSRSIRIWWLHRDSARAIPKFYAAKRDFVPPAASPELERYIRTTEEHLLKVFDGSSLSKQKTLPKPLYQALLELKREQSIVIKPADKNLGLTVFDRDHYISLRLQHLEDVSTYRSTESVPFDQISDKLDRILLRYDVRNLFGSDLIRFFKQVPENGFRANLFYVLPKLHKTPLVGKPICSATGYVTNHASRWLDDRLQPLIRSHSAHLRDSQQLLCELDSKPFDPGILLFQFDVVSLYPSIDIKHALSQIYPLIATWPGFDCKKQEAELIMDLLVWVLQNNYLEFNGRFYLQIKGVAMGTPVAVVFSCLYMMSLEMNLQKESDALNLPWPIFLRRFIDDGMGVWQGSKSDLDAWLHRYDSFYPGIRITHSISTDSVEILDIVFSKRKRFSKTGLLDTATHQKALNRYLYLPWRSFHPRAAKIAFIYGELRRYCLRESSAAGFLRIRQLFFDRFRARGYPTAFLLAVFSKISYSDRARFLREARAQVSSTAKKQAPLVFKTQFNPRVANLNLGASLKPWNVFEDLRLYSLTKTILAWKRSLNLRNLLVRARLSPSDP